MRILLTRAAEDAERTKARLEALGHEVWVSPVISYQATGATWPDVVPDGLIATSARAFLGVKAEHVARAGWRHVPLFLAGGRTEEAARACGFAGKIDVAADSSALAGRLERIPEKWIDFSDQNTLKLPEKRANSYRLGDSIQAESALNGRKVSRLVYFAGRDRKPGIENAMKATRNILLVLETYAAEASGALLPATKQALAAGHIDAILHYSHRSAGLFETLRQTAGLGIPPVGHLCLSADIAGCFQGAPVQIADTPDEVGMLALVQRCAADSPPERRSTSPI